MAVHLDTPVQYLKGAGPKVAKLLKKLGIDTIEDLIYFFPRDYEDRTRIKPIRELVPASFDVIRGGIVEIKHQTTRNRFSVLKLIVADRSGSIQAVWFNQPYLEKLFRPGMRLILSGKVEFSDFDGVNQFTVRDFEIDTGANPGIVPHYPLTGKLYPKKMRSMVQTALDSCLEEISEWLPAALRKKYRLAELVQSIKNLHFPSQMSLIDAARRRLAFSLVWACVRTGSKRKTG